MTTDFLRALTGDAEQPSATLVRHYAGSPAQLWRALTEPERLGRWLGTMLSDPPAAVGDRFRIDLGGPDNIGSGVVLACHPPARLEVTWHWMDVPQGRVAVSLAGDDQRTELTLVHDRLAPAHVADYGGGWEYFLLVLDSALSGVEPDKEAFSAAEAASGRLWRRMQDGALELTHEYAATPDQVWQAWTTAGGLATWWWNHWDGVDFVVDARVGGGYTITAPDQGIRVDGRYLVVEPERRLAFTWAWRDEDGTAPDEAVDVSFEPIADGTRLTLRHTGPWQDGTAAANYRAGWEFTLAALQSVTG